MIPRELLRSLRGLYPREERSVPIVTVQQSPRDSDAKRRLVAGITQAFVDAYGVRGEQVQVFIAEFDHEHWAKGGVLAIDAPA
jgi:4-oxalocrotonate tautomerase